jgi:signal recognition particle GTPase
MTVVQAVVVIGGSLALMSLMIAGMARANNHERQVIERRHAERIANGSNPDEKPNFFSGSGGG